MHLRDKENIFSILLHLQTDVLIIDLSKWTNKQAARG